MDNTEQLPPPPEVIELDDDDDIVADNDKNTDTIIRTTSMATMTILVFLYLVYLIPLN